MPAPEVEIEGKVRRETDKAYLFDFGAKEPVWVPKSQISDESDPDDNGIISIFIPEWLATEKGMV